MLSWSPPSGLILGSIGATDQALPPLRADAARNRELIVAAARDVFAESGLEASTAEIARRAGVGEATLYRRFPSKDDLVLAIVQTQMAEVIEVAEECLERHGPWEGVERFLHAMVERSVSDQGVHESAKDRCITHPALAEPRARVLELITKLVRRAQDAGVVRDDLAGQDVFLLVTAAGGVANLPFGGLRDDLWRRYLGIILDGIRPDGATRLRPAAPARRLFE